MSIRIQSRSDHSYHTCTRDLIDLKHYQSLDRVPITTQARTRAVTLLSNVDMGHLKSFRNPSKDVLHIIRGRTRLRDGKTNPPLMRQQLFYIASQNTLLSVTWQACCFVSANLKVISQTGSSARSTCESNV